MTVGNIPGDEQHNALKQKDLKGNTMMDPEAGSSEKKNADSAGHG